MKTLVINGSARTEGNTSALVNKILENSSGEITEFFAFRDNISACVNCGFCIKNRACAIQDKMQDIYSCIENADNIIVASPVYFGSLTGPLMNIMSRFQCYFSQYHKIPSAGKRKKGVAVLTSGGSGVPGRAEADAKLMLKMMNAEIVDVIKSCNTNELLAADDTDALEKAAAASKVLFNQ